MASELLIGASPETWVQILDKRDRSLMVHDMELAEAASIDQNGVAPFTRFIREWRASAATLVDDELNKVLARAQYAGVTRIARTDSPHISLYVPDLPDTSLIQHLTSEPDRRSIEAFVRSAMQTPGASDAVLQLRSWRHAADPTSEWSSLRMTVVSESGWSESGEGTCSRRRYYYRIQVVKSEPTILLLKFGN